MVRQLARSAVRSAAIVVMGPVILVLGGAGDITLARMLDSLRFTGPLAAVMFVGFALLDWGGSGAGDPREAAPPQAPTPPSA